MILHPSTFQIRGKDRCNSHGSRCCCPTKHYLYMQTKQNCGRTRDIDRSSFQEERTADLIIVVSIHKTGCRRVQWQVETLDDHQRHNPWPLPPRNGVPGGIQSHVTGVVSPLLQLCLSVLATVSFVKVRVCFHVAAITSFVICDGSSDVATTFFPTDRCRLKLRLHSVLRSPSR